MLLVRTGTDPGQRKGDPMNALSIIFVNQHLEELQAQSRRHPASSRVARRSMRSRIAAAADALRSALRSDGGPSVPELRDYPCGG
jgi:hypothetical protein